MVQVSSRSSNGSIKYCGVHDLLRDLAMHQAGKENFVTVFPKPQGANHPDLVTRRASFQSCTSQFKESVSPNTRSILWFGDKLPDYSGFRLLRVLEIVGVRISVELMGLDRLIHLKYLGLRNCSQLKIPSYSFSRLKDLETLDFRRTQMQYSPTGLWNIGTLRHVSHHECFSCGLPSKADLRNLQSLKWISAMDTWNKNQFPRLNNLRKLGLALTYSDALPHLLGTLTYLTSLGIRGRPHIPMEFIYPRMLPNYENLQTLYLDGRWPEGVSVEARLFPRFLVKLKLRNSGFGQDPMPELGKLKSLKELVLLDVYKGEQMNCPIGFPVLQTLVLDNWSTVFTVAQGVMPKLRKFDNVFAGVEVRMPPELKHLI